MTAEELSGAPQKTFTTAKRGKRLPRFRIKMVQEYTVKTESSPGPSTLPFEDEQEEAESSSAPLKLRPRRSTANLKSYAVPDSDDEAIADDADEMVQHVSAHAKKRKVESNMQQWIKHLSALMREEEKKVCLMSLCALRVTYPFIVQREEETYTSLIGGQQDSGSQGKYIFFCKSALNLTFSCRVNSYVL